MTPVTLRLTRFGLYALFLVTFLDGFDLTIIGVALPKIADFLHSKPTALGLALSAGQFGPLIGAIVLGSLQTVGDASGCFHLRRHLRCLYRHDRIYHHVEQLALFRFLAGFGLGGAIPNALTFG